MIKPIDRVYDLICVLSDARLASIMKRQLKQKESMLSRSGTCQKIGCRAGGSVDVSAEGFVP